MQQSIVSFVLSKLNILFSLANVEIAFGNSVNNYQQ